MISKLKSALSIVIIGIMSAFTTSSSKTKFAGTEKSVHDFTMNTLDGKALSLKQFKGKKMLLVNVASNCGFTKQYKSLQALHDKYKDKLVIVGFPANNFGGQEPGSSAEIKGFCTKNFGVTFQMMEKISVVGKDAHPLYVFLSDKTANGVSSDAPKWNFCKYLIDENGKIIKFFSSGVDPLSTDITSLL